MNTQPVVSHARHAVSPVDDDGVSATGRLAVTSGPVPDLFTISLVDDGRYGLDASFQGASGYERAGQLAAELRRRGVPHSFPSDRDGGWTLRLGPLRAIDVAAALSAFIYRGVGLATEQNNSYRAEIMETADGPRAGSIVDADVNVEWQRTG
jgi:hypothetical protein